MEKPMNCKFDKAFFDNGLMYLDEKGEVIFTKEGKDYYAAKLVRDAMEIRKTENVEEIFDFLTKNKYMSLSKMPEDDVYSMTERGIKYVFENKFSPLIMALSSEFIHGKK
jgi:hypothetical protein